MGTVAVAAEVNPKKQGRGCHHVVNVTSKHDMPYKKLGSDTFNVVITSVLERVGGGGRESTWEKESAVLT